MSLNKLVFYGISTSDSNQYSSEYIIYDEKDNIIVKGSKILSNTTNNYAKYMALCRGLYIAKEKCIKSLIIQSDSKEIINQLKGLCKCENKNVVGLYNKIISLLKLLDKYNFVHYTKES